MKKFAIQANDAAKALLDEDLQKEKLIRNVPTENEDESETPTVKKVKKIIK